MTDSFNHNIYQLLDGPSGLWTSNKCNHFIQSGQQISISNLIKYIRRAI